LFLVTHAVTQEEGPLDETTPHSSECSQYNFDCQGCVTAGNCGICYFPSSNKYSCFLGNSTQLCTSLEGTWSRNICPTKIQIADSVDYDKDILLLVLVVVPIAVILLVSVVGPLVVKWRHNRKKSKPPVPRLVFEEEWKHRTDWQLQAMSGETDTESVASSIDFTSDDNRVQQSPVVKKLTPEHLNESQLSSDNEDTNPVNAAKCESITESSTTDHTEGIEAPVADTSSHEVKVNSSELADKPNSTDQEAANTTPAQEIPEKTS
jgi:hypothetical protein